MEFNIKLTNNCSFEDLVAPLQSFHKDKIFLIINNTIFKVLTKKSEIPKNLEFLYQITSNNITKFYFKSNENQYCLFGEQAAKYFSGIETFKKKFVVIFPHKAITFDLPLVNEVENVKNVLN